MGAPEENGKTGDSRRTLLAEFAPFLTLGMQLALPVVVFFFLGRWLDQKFETAPWLMIAGLAIGTIGGFIKFFRTVLSLGDSKRPQDDKNVHK